MVMLPCFGILNYTLNRLLSSQLLGIIANDDTSPCPAKLSHSFQNDWTKKGYNAQISNNHKTTNKVTDTPLISLTPSLQSLVGFCESVAAWDSRQSLKYLEECRKTRKIANPPMPMLKIRCANSMPKYNLIKRSRLARAPMKLEGNGSS
jgi:hypothetical protein